MNPKKKPKLDEEKLIVDIVNKLSRTDEVILLDKFIEEVGAKPESPIDVFNALFKFYMQAWLDIDAFSSKWKKRIVFPDNKPNPAGGQFPGRLWITLHVWLKTYIRLAKKPTLAAFLNLGEKKLMQHSLFPFLKSINADINETFILLKTIYGFGKGQHPVFLSDMELNAMDMAYYTNLLMDGESPLIRQDLLSIKISQDGISCCLIVTKRTLELIQNKPVSVLEESYKMTSGFYTWRHSHLIAEKILYFNTSVTKVFEHFTKMIEKVKHKKVPNISLLLYGPSGTGKTEFAYQLARIAGADIMQLNYSQIHSKWIGETEKNIQKVFAEYEERTKTSKRPIILLMNEADGLMNRRVSISTSNDVFANHAQTQMLEVLEEFKGILIATTNLYRNIDVAFHRRFLFRCLLDLPDDETKSKLLESSSLRKHLSEASMKKLLASSWSAAQLHNLQRKIKQMNEIDAITETEIIEFLKEDGLLKQPREMGFTI